jgi:hypothetical protein
VYVVFAVDRFELITAAKIPDGASEQAPREEFRSLPLTGPQIVAAQRPTNASERNQLLFDAVSGGADLAQLPKYYRPYTELATEAAHKAQPLDQLLQHSNTQIRAWLSSILNKMGRTPSSIKFLPLQAPRQNQTVLIDGKTGEILKIIDIDPWDQLAAEP